ncbi:MAG: CBS domain-containing protein [Aquificaceae bacterium]|nr:CBS domain-containing protein [Aquificaceae bacterium]MDW8095976.1 CBS domain-containing protein [Aquificaceae bacterium]
MGGLDKNTKAKDLMVPISLYPSLGEDEPLENAFSLLEKTFEEGREYRNVLVLSKDAKLVGILSMMNLIEGILPSFLREVKGYQGQLQEHVALSFIWQDILSDAKRIAKSRKIKEVLRPVSATLSPEDPITKALYLMLNGNIMVLPVVQEGKVLGVVRFVDVFTEIAKLITGKQDG